MTSARVYNSAAGTVYEQTQAQGPGGGKLIIDNQNVTTGLESGYNIITDISSAMLGNNGTAGTTITVGAMTLQNQGILTVESGRTFNCGAVTINSGSTLTNLGTLSATGSWTQGGTFAAGTTAALTGPSTITGLNIASGTLTFNGGYTYTVTNGSTANGITVANGATINFNGTSDDALVTL